MASAKKKAKKLAKVRGKLQALKAVRDNGEWEGKRIDCVAAQLKLPTLAVAVAGSVQVNPELAGLEEWERWKPRWEAFEGFEDWD